MDDITAQARRATDQLLESDEDRLYAELGRRLQTMRSDPAISSSFTPPASRGLESLAAIDDLHSFGQRFFTRFGGQAYELMCGAGAEESEDRQKLLEAFGSGKEAVAPALATLLVSQLGLAPTIASVVASLAVKLFFRPGYGAMCAAWKSKLDQPASQPSGTHAKIRRSTPRSPRTTTSTVGAAM